MRCQVPYKTCILIISLKKHYIYQLLHLPLLYMEVKVSSAEYHASNPHLPTDRLKIGRHDGPELARKVLELSRRRGDPLNSRQKAALKRYRSEPIYRDKACKAFSEETVLKSYFRVFDDLFFRATLYRHCDVIFHGKDHPLMRGCAEVEISHKSMLYWVNHCIIHIYSNDGNIDPGKSLQELLGTLLHGIVHAYLLIYICNEEKCSTRLEMPGKTSRGFVWQVSKFLCLPLPPLSSESMSHDYSSQFMMNPY
jgi:hypothetical protein